MHSPPHSSDATDGSQTTRMHRSDGWDIFCGHVPHQNDRKGIKALFRLNPRALIQKDFKKRALLHLAVASQVPPPVTVIKAFMKVNPQSLKTRDDNDRLPLHSAVVAPMTTFANVEAIVDAYPGAVDLTDKDDALPVHLAAWGGGGPDALPVIELLVRHNSKSLSLKDGDEETVLTLMSKYGQTSEEAIDFVLKQDPKAILRDRVEKEGSAPLHYAVSAALGENSTIYAPILRSDPTAGEKINRLVNYQFTLHWVSVASPLSWYKT